MIVLDAGVLIGLLVPSDAHHTDAVEVISRASGALMVHTLNLAEVLAGPARFGREDAARTDLEGIGVQVADLGTTEPLLLARVRADHGLKMPDTCALATAIHLSAPLATFDAKLSKAARNLGLLHNG